MMKNLNEAHNSQTLRLKFADNLSANNNFENTLDYVIHGVFRINAPSFYLLFLLYSCTFIVGIISLAISLLSLDHYDLKQNLFESLIYIFVGVSLATFAYLDQNKIGLNSEVMDMKDLLDSRPLYYNLFRKIKWLKRFRVLPDHIENLKAKKLLRKHSEKIEEAFNVMRNERNPRAYVETNNGSSKTISHNFYFGKFRILMLSNNVIIRFMILNLPFSHGFQEIFIKKPNKELNEISNIESNHAKQLPDEIRLLLSQSTLQFQDARILNEQAKNKLSETEQLLEEMKAILNKKPGTKPQYQYLEIALGLIENPKMRDITGKRNDIENLNTIINDLNDNRKKPLKIPQHTQLSKFSKEVISAIIKNREISQ